MSISIWHFDDSPLPASNLVRCCCLLRHSSAHGWMGEIEVCNGDALSNRIYEQQVGSLRIAFEGHVDNCWGMRSSVDSSDGGPTTNRGQQSCFPSHSFATPCPERKVSTINRKSLSSHPLEARTWAINL